MSFPFVSFENIHFPILGISEVTSTTTPPPPLRNMITTVSRNMTTSMPYTCTPGWSEFMSIDTPSVLHTWEGQGLGDIEPLSELRKYYNFCANPSGIQCRVRDTRVSYIMSPDFDTECSLEKGFVCLNSVQGPIGCLDYEVSVHCDCGSKCVYSYKYCMFIIHLYTPRNCILLKT
ncbi:hypothetical protein DPMN_064585 [Dreissena polymorpha]|uniref:WxxW domain-containing protein n=1 Tax=Dreissena polymorpha TaxID=45954 RepID=A0A9D4CDF7_DREPO|nr:hypothetical protein DPMN_064585 [Dreissena polymorpha]